MMTDQVPVVNDNQTSMQYKPPLRIRLGNPKKRFSALSLFFLAVMTIYAVRLIDLQIIQGPSHARAAYNQRVQTFIVPAQRGEITDMNGVTLATTVHTVNVTTDQTLVKDPLATARKLAPVLKMPIKEIAQSLTGTLRYKIVARGIPSLQWRTIAGFDLSGIFHEPTVTRSYPGGTLAANLLGYVGAQGQGLGGLEFAMQKTLTGIDGKSTVEQVNGREIPTSERHTVDAVNGTSVRLTIDADLQGIAERALANGVRKAGAEAGDIVVMDPKTGNILSMATYPTFNPNKPEGSSDMSKQNHPVVFSFEPGSTSKMITMAAVLEEGKAKPLSGFTIPSGLPRGGRTFTDDIPHGRWRLTLNGILARSSNMGTILASERIGKQKLYDYLRKFGFGEKTGLNFPGETAGELPALDQWSATSFPTLAFGQGLSVSALQVASVYSTIANNGVRLKPRLVAGTYDVAGKFTSVPESQGIRVVSKKTAKWIREMLESVVSSEGTAAGATISGYRVAGKTGTAYRYDSKLGRYNGYTASFVGMAPADKPSLVVAVIMHRPVNGHFGSVVSAPVFKIVMTYALQHLRIPPTGTKSPHLPVTW